MNTTFSVLALIAPVLLIRFANSAAIVVLVANGSDITINLPAENSHNRLVNVISNSGNNNPSIFDWIGGNGANKAPRVSLGAVNPLTAAGERNRLNTTTDALLTAVDRALQDVMDGDGENSAEFNSAETIDIVSGTTGSLNGNVGQATFDSTTEMHNSWKRKYVTVEMKRSD